MCGLRLCACCCCVYIIKMTCAVNWIIVRERRAESTSFSHPDPAGSRGKAVSRHLELQWMTMISVVPCHAFYAPQHAAASPFGPLNQWNDFFRPSYRSRLYTAGIGKSRYVGFVWNCLLLDELQTRAWGLHLPWILLHRFGQQLYRSSNSSVLCSPVLTNSVEPDHLASEEANWSLSALFVIKYVNFYQKPGSSNLTGWKLEVGVAS